MINVKFKSCLLDGTFTYIQSYFRKKVAKYRYLSSNSTNILIWWNL